MSSLREYWSQLYGGIPMADTDVKVIGDALSGFFSLLKTWDDKDKEVIENGENNRGNIPSAGP